MLLPRLNQTRKSGQTLIIALIVLGILLILGFVFLGIVNQGLKTGARGQRRTLTGDLADAGIRYAHSQLLTSGQGADWQPQATLPFTNDPDADLLRQPSADPTDRGGPDKLGPYSRIQFDNGRAMIRVRYGPSDPVLFLNSPTGPLRKPSLARNYLILESVGRLGRVNPNDPTTLNGAATREQAKRIAFADIGIIDYAFFVTNKWHQSRAAEIGVPFNLGVPYLGFDVAIPTQFGASISPLNFGGAGQTESSNPLLASGSMWFNTDLKIYGHVTVGLLPAMGDYIAVNGTITGQNDNNFFGGDTTKEAELLISTADPDAAGNWPAAPTLISLKNDPANPDGVLNSRDPHFYTHGLLRDGMSDLDPQGFPRGVPYKEPPSILTTNAETGLTRYLEITKESGPLVNGINSGHYGQGSGIYVDNSDDRQAAADENGRLNAGSTQSLPYDWLNPNNGNAKSGWQGPFYVPPASYLTLLADGFTITRNQKGSAPTWKRADGTDTGQGTIRYRVGKFNGLIYIVNSFTPGVNIEAINSSDVHFELGQPFNGVLYFEGNVRVRGTIPTSTQMTVVSNASIYIEGSITKGLVENNVYSDTPNPSRLITSSPTAMCGLLAKDYVAFNTTQIFGSAEGGLPEEVKDVPSAVGYNPLRLPAANGALNLRFPFLLDPQTMTPGSGDPSSEKPYALMYNNGTNNIDSQLLLTHTMDDGPAPYTFISLDINYPLDNPLTAYADDWPYLFDLSTDNAATPLPPFSPNPNLYITPNYDATTQGRAPVYGLGVQAWQRYSRFETQEYPIVHADTAATFTFPNLTPTVGRGTYMLLSELDNDFRIRTTNVGGNPTNDYLFAKVAMAPYDVRIEAVIFAEEGSFFVIPGTWFNPNPNDRRDTYAALGATQAERDQARKENFGSSPSTPFYGEPLDVRIQIFGAVSENMTPPISQQAEWNKKWGWIPGQLGATGTQIPTSHVPTGWNLVTTPYVPNLIISFDPALASGRPNGFLNTGSNQPIRKDGPNVLPPLPRLPVSPQLQYVGEEAS